MADGNPKIKLRLSPEAEKYVRRDAPVGVRRMAARGALPLQPVELATVLFVLHHDADEETKSTARESLEGLPENILVQVLEGQSHPAVLSLLARVHRDHEGHCERLSLNGCTSDSTLVFLAGLPHRRVVDIVSQNQARMMRCEGIVEALGDNPLTGRAVIDRILAFLGKAAEEEGELDVDDELGAEAAEEAVRALLGDADAGLARALCSDDEIEDEKQFENLFAAVQTMTVMQKVKLARLGGSEARALLIRDRNKIVASAAISSPRITDNEVVTYAQSRGVSDEVLRIIAANRDWTKSYQVKRALATNPKVPQSSALQFLNYLQDRDLKAIMKSKDVPSAVSAHARRILQKKGKI